MERRTQLIADIEADVRQTALTTGVQQLSKPVLRALATVPRHEFVPPTDQGLAYENEALAIGHEQTISQPFIVALMTELLNIKNSDIILEVGTGSGYQAAILSLLAKQVYSVEIIPSLAITADARLKRLGYNNVTVRYGDGNFGLSEFGLYDGIIVTAATTEVPKALIDQLKPGKNLIIPLGESGSNQILTLIKKNKSGELEQRQILPVRFVPLVDG